MSNDYFDSGDWTRLVQFTLARSELVNAIVDAIVAGLDKLPSESRLKEGRVTYLGAVGGSASVLTATAPYTMTLTDGMTITALIGTTNTGPATLNISAPSALGAVAIVNYAGAALSGGELAAGTFVDLRYKSSGNHFRIVNPQVAVGNVTVNNLTVVTGSDTTPGNLSSKITVSGLVKTVTSPGGNENLNLAIDEGNNILLNRRMSR